MNKIYLSIQIVSLALLALMFQTIYIYGKYAKDLESRFTQAQPSASTMANEPSTSPIAVNPEFDAKEYIDSVLATFSASTPAPAPTLIASEPSHANNTSYITMDGTRTTTSTDWVDVPGSEVYIDLINDYSKNAYVTFTATLKVAHGNGQAFVRLYDATNKIAVSGSELTTINNATETQVSSNNLSLWSGNNLYKVQIKSLNSFEITYTNGKLKIRY